MRTHLISLLLAVPFIALSGCGKESSTKGKTTSQTGNSGLFPHELVDFVPYEGNPVFAGTGQDTWDRSIRERGYILREGDTWHLWYTGYNDDLSDTKYLGYATSADGLVWTRYPGNPIVDSSWVEERILHPGDFYRAPIGVEHNAWTLEEPSVLLDLFAPPREDLIKK